MNISSIKSNSLSGFLRYGISPDVTAFSPLRDAVLPMPVVQAHQVHGDRVAVVESAALTREDLEGFDALITDVPGVAIGARTADCIPVLMYDPVRRAVAAVHSGWKGTVLKIAAKTLAVMASKYGTRAADIIAVIGPGIGPDSFQVGPEVAGAFLAAGFPETWSRPDTDDYGTAGTGKTVVRLITDRGPRIPGSMSGSSPASTPTPTPASSQPAAKAPPAAAPSTPSCSIHEFPAVQPTQSALSPTAARASPAPCPAASTSTSPRPSA